MLLVAVAPPPPPPKIAPHITMRARNVIAERDGRGDRADEDVVVAHVRDLVREHAAQLVLVDDLQQALRHRDRGVVLVAAGRERVRLRRPG